MRIFASVVSKMEFQSCERVRTQHEKFNDIYALEMVDDDNDGHNGGGDNRSDR